MSSVIYKYKICYVKPNQTNLIFSQNSKFQIRI